MNCLSPPSQIYKLTSLEDFNKSDLIEDEPTNLDNISFNEQLVILKYNPKQRVTLISDDLLNLFKHRNIPWINPQLCKTKQYKKSTSILKKSDHTY